MLESTTGEDTHSTVIAIGNVSSFSTDKYTLVAGDAQYGMVVKAATVNPSKRQMRAIERDAEARIAVALAKMRRAMLSGLTADNVQYLPGKLRTREVLQPFTDSIVSVLRDIALAGASFGREQIERFVFGTQKRIDAAAIAVDWELVNTDAEEWARAYGYDLVRGIGDTTQRRLQKEVSAWVTNNESINQLRDRLSQPNGPFSPERARTIAVTETTRAYAEGNRAAWRNSGVTQQRWNTNVDEIVCPICGPMHNVVIGIDETFEAGGPPAHPNCRCWITPVVEGAEERETGLGQFGLGETATAPAGQPGLTLFSNDASIAEVEKWLVDSGFATDVNLSGLSDESAREVGNGFGIVDRKYKRLRASSIRTEQSFNGVAYYDPVRNEYVLSIDNMGTPDKYKRLMDSANDRYGSSVLYDRALAPESISEAIVHEYNHALVLDQYPDWALSRKWDGGGVVRRTPDNKVFNFSDWMSGPNAASHRDYRKKLGWYSDSQFQEYIAESFVEHTRGGEIHPDVARFFVERLEK